MNIDYLPAEYCLDRCFHFLIPRRDDWNPDAILPPDVVDVYTVGSKLDNGVGSSVYSGKLEINSSLCLLDYCSLFQTEMMAIYRVAQRILTNGASFTSVSVFSDSQAVIQI